jgi:hypothetical protein
MAAARQSATQVDHAAAGRPERPAATRTRATITWIPPGCAVSAWAQLSWYPSCPAATTDAESKSGTGITYS